MRDQPTAHSVARPARDIASFEGLLRRITGEYFVRGMDFDDLLQEARIGAWQALKAHRSDGGRALTGFVVLFARRRLVTVLKLSQAQRRSPEQPDWALEAPVATDGDLTLGETIPCHDDPFDILCEAEELGELTARIRCLSDIERSALVLVANGRTYEEIATALGQNHKAIDNAVQRARGKLRATGPPELRAA